MAVNAVVVRKQDRLFFTSMAVVAAVSVFIGFAPTFYLKPYFSTPPLTPLLVVHGMVFSAWIVLFVAQTVLIATHRTAVHRRLGWAGAALAALMVIVGALTGIVRAKVVEAPTGLPPLAFLTIPLGDVFVFGCLAGAAIYFRRRLDVHKRLMMIATCAILPAATVLGGLLLIASHPLRLAIGTTPAWLTFAEWITG